MLRRLATLWCAFISLRSCSKAQMNPTISRLQSARALASCVCWYRGRRQWRKAAAILLSMGMVLPVLRGAVKKVAERDYGQLLRCDGVFGRAGPLPYWLRDSRPNGGNGFVKGRADSDGE